VRTPRDGRRGVQRPLAPGALFALALIAMSLLVAVRVLHHRDLFGSRINTIFKFYYQAWDVGDRRGLHQCTTVYPPVAGARGVSRAGGGAIGLG
jgi:hypothetical protein